MSDADFANVERRRHVLNQRLNDMRVEQRTLRASPGFLARVEEHRRGKALKGDVLERVLRHEELDRETGAFETEVARLGTIGARHRRAIGELAEVEAQLNSAEQTALQDLRRICSERLAARGDALDLSTVPRAHFLATTLRGLRAKERVLAEIGERLRPTTDTIAKHVEKANGAGPLGLIALQATLLDVVPGILAALERGRDDIDAVARFDAYQQVVDRGGLESWRHAFALPSLAISAEAPLVTVATPRPMTLDAEHLQVVETPLAMSAAPAPLAAAMSAATPLAAPTSANTMAMLPALALDGADSMSSTGVFRELAALVGDSDDDDDFAEDTEAVPAAKRPAAVDIAPPTPAPTTSPGSFRHGIRVGRYVVDSLIGKGGMAEVYLATQEGHAGFTKKVVLKRMNEDLRGHQEIALMFSREAHIAGQLQHPNLVNVFDFLAVDGETFIVMEYLRGASLQRIASVLRRAGTPLASPVILRAIADAARGLHAAHMLQDDAGKVIGLIHRDISPDNLFLTTNGFTKVLDFGIAKRDDLTTLTGKNELKGKIPYMAPEHIQSEALDARADIFSLGATLYWLLSGTRPFVGHNEVATLHAVLTKAPPPLAGVAADVEALVMAMLHKNRDARPSSAADVARACERLGAASHDDAAAAVAALAAS